MSQYFKESFPPMPLTSGLPPFMLITWKISSTFYFIVFASKCWFFLLQAFNFCWVFYHVFKNNVSQILAGPDLKKKTAELLWANTVKTLLAEIWFERNQIVSACCLALSSFWSCIVAFNLLLLLFCCIAFI